jgi:hypothetical protein
MTAPADLSALPEAPDLSNRNPAELFGDLTTVIKAGISGNPRSKQTRLGPSEIGCPCARKLGYKLAGTPPVNAGDVAWRPEVGTAVHAHLADRFTQANADLWPARWLVEHRVQPGMIGGEVLDGHCDLYDRWTRTVIDWKIVGTTTLRQVRAHGPAMQYVVQLHTYGKGWVARGAPVARVAICYLPSAGELSDAVWWTAPFDERVADEAIARAEAIAGLVSDLGAGAPTILPTAEAYCKRCEWFLPAATDLTEACPGHAEASVV